MQIEKAQMANMGLSSDPLTYRLCDFELVTWLVREPFNFKKERKSEAKVAQSSPIPLR